MGFGLLLIGYIFAFVAAVGLGPYIFAGMMIGGFFMYLGLSELKKYDPVFIYALIFSILMILCSVFRFAMWIDDFIGLGLNLNTVTMTNVFSWVKFAIYIGLDFTVLYGIADLSRRVDFPDTRSKAYRNMVIVGFFYLFQAVMLMPFVKGLTSIDFNFLMTLLTVFQVIYAVINAWLMFKCYAMICPEGQEDMPLKKSRFEFVNRIREKRSAKEDQAVEDMKKYYENKLREKNAKRQSKHKKK